MSEWEKFVDQFITRGGYKRVLGGLLSTIEIAVFGLIIGIVIGTLIAVIRVMPKKGIVSKILDKICITYVAFFRGTPMVVQLLIGHFILLPALGITVDTVIEAILIFGMNSGAYVSEIMRGGINSIDIGQMEAGRALGLGFWTTMLKVVVPQAVKNILPTLGNEFISLIKETSVVSFIAVTDLTRAFRQIGDATYAYLVPYLMLAAVYLIIVLLITYLVRCLERRMKVSDRK